MKLRTFPPKNIKRRTFCESYKQLVRSITLQEAVDHSRLKTCSCCVNGRLSLCLVKGDVENFVIHSCFHWYKKHTNRPRNASVMIETKVDIFLNTVMSSRGATEH